MITKQKYQSVYLSPCLFPFFSCHPSPITSLLKLSYKRYYNSITSGDFVNDPRWCIIHVCALCRTIAIFFYHRRSGIINDYNFQSSKVLVSVRGRIFPWKSIVCVFVCMRVVFSFYQNRWAEIYRLPMNICFRYD